VPLTWRDVGLFFLFFSLVRTWQFTRESLLKINLRNAIIFFSVLLNDMDVIKINKKLCQNVTYQCNFLSKKIKFTSSRKTL
jgi:hypothetical protein